MSTAIEWADATWNPTIGCSRVTSGCDNCYAFRIHDQRFNHNRVASRSASGPDETVFFFPKQYDRPFSEVQLLEDRLEIPLRRRKPTRYFVDSMADLFHSDVPDAFLDRVFGSMLLAQRHQFLILTKRPERMLEYVGLAANRDRLDRWLLAAAGHYGRERGIEGDVSCFWNPYRQALQNVWLGVSAEDQAAADRRLPILRQVPAAVRFVSAEPLLSGVNLKLDDTAARIDWVIAGGETGPRSRPMALDAIRHVRDQCRAVGVPFFFKQWGDHDATGKRIGRKRAGRELDGRRWDEFPEPALAAVRDVGV